MVKADSAASAVWIAHGLVMNGGVVHCVEALNKRELRAAIAGYRFFGLPAVAEALEQAMKVRPEDPGRVEPVLDALYNRAIPDDAFLDAQMSRALPPDEPRPSADLIGQQAIGASIALFITFLSSRRSWYGSTGRIASGQWPSKGRCRQRWRTFKIASDAATPR